MASQRYFVRTKRSRLIYRDGGKFISKEEAIKRGIPPQEIEVTTFQDQNGKFASKEKVKRSKRKIVDKIRGEGVLEPDKKPKQLEEAPVFISIMGQQMRRLLLEASVEGDNIGFIWRGRFYEVKPTERHRVQEAWLRLSRAAVKRFKQGGSLYYSVDIAESKNGLIIDFDSLIPNDQDPESEEYKQAIKAFRSDAATILKGLY